jgi:EAL domain-containing protein (putative c-di-GMP-specific phosphodiesterase class I)
VRIAIDDFGTGYSSLTYLKNIKADRLKLDRSFIKDLGTDRADEAIALAVLALGRTLNLKVTAEGVETVAQWSFLRDNGCDEMQGFLFAAPAPAEEVGRLILSKNALTASGAFAEFWAGAVPCSYFHDTSATRALRSTKL